MRNSLRLFAVGCLATVFMLCAGVANAQTTKEEFMSKWQNSKQFTIDVLNKMPDSGMDYKTDPEAMSFKEQIHHIASSIDGIAQGFLKGKESGLSIDLDNASKAELAAYVAQCYDYGATTMMALSPEDAGETLEVFGSNVTRRQVMAMLMDHSTHHRGSAIAYLRAEGVQPPAFVGF